MEAAAIKVAVRVRPLSSKENEEGMQAVLVPLPETSSLILGSGKNEKPFAYDFVFGSSCTSSDVYEKSVAPLLIKALDGYNITIFAYGQTGSGKTYTMDSVTRSLVRDLFSSLSDGHLVSWRATVSVAEIYQEQVYDLLSTEGASTAKNVIIRDNDAGEVVVSGLTDVTVASADDAAATMARGLAARATASTQMNTRSSRSHAVYTITVEQTSAVSDSGESLGIDEVPAAPPSLSKKVSRINLVDLAGSERAKRTGAAGERLREAASINKGLLALGNVINALASIEDEASAAASGAATTPASDRHVPFRDSKLTRLLKSSLGGNAHTLMIACCSPADSYLEETLSTLRYAARARAIKNKASINMDAMTGELGALRRQVREMQLELLRARAAAAAAGGGLSSEDNATSPRKTTPSTTNAENGVHSFSCTGCGRCLQVECSNGARSASSDGGVDGNLASRLAASDDALQRLKIEHAQLYAQHSQLSSQYAEVAAELCIADAARQRIELLGTLVSACKGALAKADTESHSVSADNGVLADIRNAVDLVEAAAQAAGGDEAVGSSSTAAVGEELDPGLFDDLYLDDLVPTASTPSDAAATLVSVSDVPAPSIASQPSAASAVIDAAAVSVRNAFVTDFNKVSTRIRDAEAALASERLAREKLERQLRIKSSELQRFQDEHTSTMEELQSALAPPGSVVLAVPSTRVTPKVDVTALQAQLADRESRIRSLSVQVSEIQRRLGDDTRQARMASLEREAAVLRETRAELQRRMREETARSNLERRALAGRLAQEERRSRKQAAELERLQTAFNNQEAMGRRKQEQLAAAQRRIRELAEKSNHSGADSSASSQVAAAIIAQLAARDSAVTTARQIVQSTGASAADATAHVPGHFYLSIAGASAASKALSGGAVHFAPRLGELVRRGERDGSLPSAVVPRKVETAEIANAESRDPADPPDVQTHAQSEQPKQSTIHEDGLVNLGSCFDNRDRDRVPTWVRPLLEADIAARVALARARKMHRRLTAERSALLTSPTEDVRLRQQRSDLLTLQIMALADVVLTLDTQVNQLGATGSSARVGARASRTKVEHWSFRLSDLKDAKASLKWAVSTVVALAETCDTLAVQLAAERHAHAKHSSGCAEGSDNDANGSLALVAAQCMELQATLSAHVILGCKLAQQTPQVEPTISSANSRLGDAQGGEVYDQADDGDVALPGTREADYDEDDGDDDESNDDSASEDDSDFSADEKVKKRKRGGAGATKKPPRARALPSTSDAEDEAINVRAAAGSKKKKTAAALAASADETIADRAAGPCNCGKSSTCTRCPCKAAGRNCCADCLCNKSKCKNHATSDDAAVARSDKKQATVEIDHANPYQLLVADVAVTSASVVMENVEHTILSAPGSTGSKRSRSALADLRVTGSLTGPQLVADGGPNIPTPAAPIMKHEFREVSVRESEGNAVRSNAAPAAAAKTASSSSSSDGNRQKVALGRTPAVVSSTRPSLGSGAPVKIQPSVHRSSSFALSRPPASRIGGIPVGTGQSSTLSTSVSFTGRASLSAAAIGGVKQIRSTSATGTKTSSGRPSTSVSIFR